MIIEQTGKLGKDEMFIVSGTEEMIYFSIPEQDRIMTLNNDEMTDLHCFLTVVLKIKQTRKEIVK